jgi:hypothetical protein
MNTAGRMAVNPSLNENQRARAKDIKEHFSKTETELEKV